MECTTFFSIPFVILYEVRSLMLLELNLSLSPTGLPPALFLIVPLSKQLRTNCLADRLWISRRSLQRAVLYCWLWRSFDQSVWLHKILYFRYRIPVRVCLRGPNQFLHVHSILLKRSTRDVCDQIVCFWMISSYIQIWANGVPQRYFHFTLTEYQ